MSRLGKLPVEIPGGVKTQIQDSVVNIEGPKGKLNFAIPGGIDVGLQDNKIITNRSDDSPDQRAKHGLARAVIANMVHGVSQGFKKTLVIKGVGYRAAVKGKSINLNLGFSHPVDFPLPDGVTAKVEANTTLHLESADKVVLGDTAAKIRALRPPEPYQGKGIRYSDETIRRKAGKSAAGGK